MVMPQMMMQQPACCPQAAPPCVPCNPCPNECCPSECSPCESGYQGEYFGGYMNGASMDGGCQNCGPTTTYDPGYLVPGSEIPQGNVVPRGSGTRTDPGPTTQN